MRKVRLVWTKSFHRNQIPFDCMGSLPDIVVKGTKTWAYESDMTDGMYIFIERNKYSANIPKSYFIEETEYDPYDGYLFPEIE